DWYDRYHCSQDAARDPDGVDRRQGRLYRLRYGEAPPPLPVRFDLLGETDEQLFLRLSSGNIYFRESAQRILTERAASSDGLRAALEKWVFEETAPRHARLHALWARLGAAPLDASFTEKLLTHKDATFRAWAVRAAGN